MQVSTIKMLKTVSDALRKLYSKLFALESSFSVSDFSTIDAMFKQISNELEDFAKTEDYLVLTSNYLAISDLNVTPEYNDFLTVFSKDIREILDKERITVSDVSKVLAAIDSSIIMKWINYLDELIAK